MAINITQEPTTFYPAYNNSYLQFTTTFGVDDKALVEIDSTYQFTVFPDINGNYLFNMREVVKALVNQNQFKDEVDSLQVGWGFSDSSLYKEITVDITTYGDDTTESLSKTYSFNKSVKQFGDKDYSNPYQLMLPSNDGINFKLTYFEGYPLELPFRYVQESIATTVTNPDNSTTTTYNNEITIKNQRTEQITTAFRPTASAPYRLFIDKGLTNWHSAGVLELPDMMSRLDIRVDGIVNTSLELTKKANECGKYLKWFNADGSYSYWLFHQWFKQDYAGKEIDRISTNNYSNIYSNNEGLTKLSGKSGGSSIKLKTIVTEAEKNHLISLVTSPMVQMWSEEDPYQDGEWISVKVTSNGFSYSNKRTRNQIEVEIELPEINTQIL